MNFVRIMHSAPELMQGIVRQVCQYLDITQIVTGGHNPRGNAICERVNQTLGAMIRKLSDLDYKDLKNFLPSFKFMINTTLSSATKCTPIFRYENRGNLGAATTQLPGKITNYLKNVTIGKTVGQF